MRESLKQKMDESVPAEITLSDVKKRQILKAAQNHDAKRKTAKSPKWMPALAGVAVIGLAGVLASPYVSDWQEQRGAVEEKKLEPQKLVVPGHNYDVLIPSIYNEYSEELLVNTNDRIYAYDPATDKQTVLADLDEGTRSFQFDSAGKWLAWEEFSDEAANLKIMNQETGEVETIEEVHVIDLELEGDHLVYGQFGGEDTPSYHSVDLNTMETEAVHEMTSNEVGMGPAAVWNNTLVIPETVDAEGAPVSHFYVYNLEDNSLIKQITLPNPAVNNVVIDNNRIYAEFWRENMDGYFLGYVDIETEEVTEIAVPEFMEFAVYGDYLALSETAGEDSSELQLYNMSGTGLEKVPAFSAIKERLVAPRFTDDGKLLVNGEGDDLAMYLLDVTK